ncbi:bifunctional 4-hydroxy-2-oxoglutarate aldolase/2-dehydro-3-deoxy-phosphogluconate aldolase [Rhodococcoides yunnanense]|uniref:bifunctional 4-hydroxy-2-oxoglutarate aldolase/2-dehydro-3-deoxy-phosphogluconate aldolase n=1 Tax=Rhodococcoides yunnanense TaxID=278209 RepID=UPI000A0757CC|nr:bifunctional 4-hydroxy-2-oxoglutarate aldolase/2-dehydro-3-deoxy-phosphogluconate aldolase [Rhodococcus yunnanensis]
MTHTDTDTDTGTDTGTKSNPEHGCDPSGLTAALKHHGLVAILRSRTPGPLVDVLRVLADAGVRIMEITIPTPGSLQAVREATDEFGSSILVGTGTVLTEAEVHHTAAAGGRFVVSPNVDPTVIGAARAARVGSLPGAYTPTEIVEAWRHRPSAVKVFPASGLGPGYLADIAAPLPDIPLVPTGGIRVEDVAAYRNSGAIAVGVSSPLVGDALTGGSLHELYQRATEFVAAARGEQ